MGKFWRWTYGIVPSPGKKGLCVYVFIFFFNHLRVQQVSQTAYVPGRHQMLLLDIINTLYITITVYKRRLRSLLVDDITRYESFSNEFFAILCCNVATVSLHL